MSTLVLIQERSNSSSFLNVCASIFSSIPPLPLLTVPWNYLALFCQTLSPSSSTLIHADPGLWIPSSGIHKENPGLIHFPEPFPMKTEQVAKTSNYQMEIARGLLPSTHTDNLDTESRIMFCVLAKSWRMRNATYFSAVWKNSFSPFKKNLQPSCKTLRI